MATIKAKLADIPARTGGGFYLHPERFAGRHEAALAKAVGLTQFGVNHMTLDPGAYSSLRHWHEREDEFVLVLSGEVTLIDDNGEHELTNGDIVGFPAGAANGHHLTNRTAAPATFLVVGSRHVGLETVHYPDDEPRIRTSTRSERGDRI